MTNNPIKVTFYQQLSDSDKLKFMLFESALKQMPDVIEVEGFHSPVPTKEVLIKLINERFD